MLRRDVLALGAASLAGLVAGCSTTKVPRVAPERTIAVKAPQKKVKEQVALLLVQRGYQLTKDSDFLMEFSYYSNNVMANLLLGSQYDPRVQTRLTITFIGDNPTNLSWRGYLVTNPGSAFERLTEVTNNPDGDNIQAQLNAIKAQLEA